MGLHEHGAFDAGEGGSAGASVMTASISAYDLLHERIRRHIWQQGWEALRPVQEAAIPPILSCREDVLVAAATAEGKTEAAFLPALTHLLQQREAGIEGLIIYVSPIKALINDQFGRLGLMCEQFDIPVWPWHGDVSAGQKKRFLTNPVGVLLITPESLEAFFCHRATAIGQIFAGTRYLIVDELHAFIGSERGKQLQSLMHRMEVAAGRRIVRIGLSATLGDMRLAARYLRPGSDPSIVEPTSAAAEIRVLLKGHEETGLRGRAPTGRHAREKIREGGEEGAATLTAPARIAAQLFRQLYQSNNLVFPNSREEVERYTYLLRQHCERERLPVRFWPHHGSLSREIRMETEQALKQQEQPATAICTNTLELGIDIGAVRSVVQIGSPPSVAALRQRLGRSGRRKGEPAILRAHVIESELDGRMDDVRRLLRTQTLQLAASISLLLEKWFEPPRVDGLHFSTLVQQILSVIAQDSGATAVALYRLLCGPGAPFEAVSLQDLSMLLRALGEREMIMQDASGLLLPAPKGERILNHYAFYAAFDSEEEFRVVHQGKSLGQLPARQMLKPGQRILFAGKTWEVDEIDTGRKSIVVSRAAAGTPPPFTTGSVRTHTRVRQRMREILRGVHEPAFLDTTARRFVDEARRHYQALRLDHECLHRFGRDLILFTWLGDAANEALVCLLGSMGVPANLSDVGVGIMPRGQGIADIHELLVQLATADVPPVEELLAGMDNLAREKWDDLLPLPLLQRGYASLHLDLAEARSWLRAYAGLQSET